LRIFLSYSSRDFLLVEPIYLALRAQKHSVFFDRSDLPAGEEYHIRIRQAIEKCHLFLFIISPNSLAADSYSLAEISMAQKMWAHPTGKLLPVVLHPVDVELLPPYLKSVLLLQAEGNIVAAVSAAVHRIATKRRRTLLRNCIKGLLLATFIGAGIYFYWANREPALEIDGKDGGPAILIAAGNFTMGDNEESPLRNIYLNAFYMDKYEVTTLQYSKFLQENQMVSQPEYWEEVDLDSGSALPVIGVDWEDARAYCKWAGKRLPTEAEWEKAARGTNGSIFPWGNDKPTSKHARFGMDGSEPYKNGLAAVGSYSSGKSPYGIFDLAGNVSEWVGDWYQESFESSDFLNPKGPESGIGKVIRGGGWYDPWERLKSTKRFQSAKTYRSDDLGFRCACDVGK
jgi:formylglycine-generating enzyme required for sulfatase activity